MQNVLFSLDRNKKMLTTKILKDYALPNEKPTKREIERIDHPVAPNRTNNPVETDQPRQRAPVLNAEKKVTGKRILY